jgi:hypothetical protein
MDGEYDVIERQNRRISDANTVGNVKLHTSCGETQEVFMNCCSQGNTTLWILIALLVLGTKDGAFCSGIFTGCGLPIVAALLFCLYKNGTLSALLTPPCNCGCCH